MKLLSPKFLSGLVIILILGVIGFAVFSFTQRGSEQDVAVTDAERVKILVEEPGIYRVSLDDLQAAGLLVDAVAVDTLRLSSRGTEVPYLIDDDGLIFYGNASDNRYAAQKAYVLERGLPGTLIESAESQSSADATVDSVQRRLFLEENRFYDPRAYQPENTEVWFWQTIRNLGDSNQFAVDIDLPTANVTDSAELQLNLYGATYDSNVPDDHDFDLYINDQLIDTVVWDGQVHHTATVPIPPNVLQAGSNTIMIDNSGEGSTLLDIVLLNWLSLTYSAHPTAVNDMISFVDTQGAVKIDGFSAEPVMLDITDPLVPMRLNEDGDSVGVNRSMTVIGAGPDGFQRPFSIEPMAATTLRDTTNQADLLIVTSAELQPELEPLITTREAEGLAVAAVTVTEIYDEFGAGEPSPDAINAFVRFTHENWAEPLPRYLFLVGDASTDTRGYLEVDDETDAALRNNIVPSPLIEVSHSGETVSDARLADVDGDLKPDLAVGRWPVSTPEEVRALVARTLAYEVGDSAENALFAMDGTSTEFSNFTSSLISASAFPDQQATLLDGPSAQTVADSWNEGAWLVSYIGHGSLDLWGKDEVFSAEQVVALEEGGTPPIVLQFTCLSGQFAHPEVDSLSETLLRHDSGPVLLVAASSLTLSSSQQPFAVALLQALQNPDVERIGDALQFAKTGLNTEGNQGLQEISDTFGLFGDPSARIVRPETDG
jgi:hypothetical protein